MSITMLKGKELSCLQDVKIVKDCEKLNISDNLLKDFQGIEQVGEKLTWLNASHNQIHSIRHLKCCTKLNVLNVSYNKINSVNGLRKLKDLKALIVNNNELKSLDGIQTLKQLNTLVISGNDLESIDVTPLSKLEKFSASHNRLKEFPNLLPLKDIKDVKLNENQIQSIPSWITSCKRIKVLDLGNNQLKDVESIKILNQLPFLENLNLKGNQLCGEEDYYIKMKTLFPSLKILDYKKMAELYFKAIETKAQQRSETKNLRQNSDTKSTEVQRDRGFKNSIIKRGLEDSPSIKSQLDKTETKDLSLDDSSEIVKIEENSNNISCDNLSKQEVDGNLINNNTSAFKMIEDEKVGQKRKILHSPNERSGKDKKKKTKKKEEVKDRKRRKDVVSVKESKRRTGVVSVVTIKNVKKNLSKEKFATNQIDIPQW